MTTAAAAAWVCLLSPLAAVALIAAAGDRLGRRAAGLVSTASTFAAFAAAAVGFVAMLGDAPAQRVRLTTSWTWLAAGHPDQASAADPPPAAEVHVADPGLHRGGKKGTTHRVRDQDNRDAWLCCALASLAQIARCADISKSVIT